MARWLLCNLGAGLMVRLFVRGLIRQNDAKPLLEGYSRILAGLAFKPMGLQGNLPSLIDEDRDGLHRLRPHQHAQPDGTIGQHGLAALIALLPGFQLGFLDGIGLLKLVELFWRAPKALKVVIEQVAVSFDANREAPAIELDAGALGDAVKKPDFASGRFRQVQPAAGGLDRVEIRNFRFDCDRVTHAVTSSRR
jgi:hypothetical protein